MHIQIKLSLEAMESMQKTRHSSQSFNKEAYNYLKIDSRDRIDSSTRVTLA